MAIALSLNSPLTPEEVEARINYEITRAARRWKVQLFKLDDASRNRIPQVVREHIERKLSSDLSILWDFNSPPTLLLTSDTTMDDIADDIAHPETLRVSLLPTGAVLNSPEDIPHHAWEDITGALRDIVEEYIETGVFLVLGSVRGRNI